MRIRLRHHVPFVTQALARQAPDAMTKRPDATAPENGATNATHAYESLRDSIISGEVPAGGRVVERTIAERLGISRTPVRSALQRLEQEGYLESIDQGEERRLVVAPLTLEDGRELFLLVGNLEGLAIRQAVTLPRPARVSLVRRMRALNRALAIEARRQPGLTRAFELDDEFHASYVRGIAGPRLTALLHGIKPQAERYARLYVSVLLAELPISVREHETIIAAVDRGDTRAAQRAVESNWHNAARRLVRAIVDFGERGHWHRKRP